MNHVEFWKEYFYERIGCIAAPIRRIPALGTDPANNIINMRSFVKYFPLLLIAPQAAIKG